jgi:hypothetical protein
MYTDSLLFWVLLPLQLPHWPPTLSLINFLVKIDRIGEIFHKTTTGTPALPDNKHYCIPDLID